MPWELPSPVLDPVSLPPPGVDDIPIERVFPEMEGDELTPLVFGAGALGNSYNSTSTLNSDVPLRAVRAAFRAGVNAIDTAPHYHPSEIVLGPIFEALTPEFPRESYKLSTKVGRYGMEWDYSPSRIRESVARSLKRLRTSYLDIVYLHDIEFVASPVGPSNAPGQPSIPLLDPSRAAGYGLAEGEGQAGKIWGEGDEKVLEAVRTLFELKKEGLVHAVGISGLPLPTLLRLSILILHTLRQPLDYLLSYCTHTLHSTPSPQPPTSSTTNFSLYAPHFTKRAKIPPTHLLLASPYSMGLLTPRGPPAWHPAPAGLRAAGRKAAEVARGLGTDLARVAGRFGMRPFEGGEAGTVKCVAGWSTEREVLEGLKAWTEANGAGKGDGARELEEERSVREVFVEEGWAGWVWGSGRQVGGEVLGG